MKNSKNKKPVRKIKIVEIKRSQKEWESLINEARNKEMNWKYMKEFSNDELSEREEETL
jgi:hypothetical protein